MSKRRVVITGMGMLSPVGNSVEESWKNILASKSGVETISTFDASAFATQFSASVKGFDVTSVMSNKDARKMDNFIHYGIAAAIEAIEDSGIEVTDENATRIGVSVGSGIGGLGTIEANYEKYTNSGPRKISPFLIPAAIINMISGNLSIRYGFKGPNYAITTACATATHSIGDAARMIEHGDADVMITGGAEDATTILGLGGFAAARALSARNDDPTTASRPWDKDRDGFVLGDGAGVVVLEEYETAKKRGATIYAEVIGFGMSGDAYHMTSPSQGGEGASRCMNNAINDAGINPDEVDYVNAHGTSTPAGDIAEVQAAKLTFGDHAKKIAMSSTKSMTGHLLGAAGGIEAIFAVLAIRDQVAPPTINIFNADEGCDLNFVPDTPQEMKIDVAVSNSFGFGGTNGTLIFRKI
ncbi:MAG: beta-ketoacyl-ACP synthase II [Gammaproteobacteria bacterium]|nr:beta-ketoacyl-ACP synthase II [Gammaproteobacteria bacterium]